MSGKSRLALLILVLVSIISLVIFNPLQTKNEFQYQNDTKYKKTFSDLKLIFCIIVRDNEVQLRYSSLNIERMAMRVANSTVIVVENDSKDKTIEFLKEWDKKVKKNPSLHIKEIDINSFVWDARPKDFDTYARARNEILSVIKAEKYKGYDMVVMVDTDTCLLWDMNNIEEIFNTLLPYEGVWDAVFVNGAKLWTNDGWPEYHDRFAYRDKNVVWDPRNGNGFLFHAGDNKKLNPVMQKWWENSYINPFNCTPLPGKFDKYDCKMFQGHPLTFVHSAFGGIAFYSTKIIYPGLCEYKSDYDCEHVIFNNCLREKFNATLVISGRMVVDLGDECSGDPRESVKVKNLLKKAPPIN